MFRKDINSVEKTNQTIQGITTVIDQFHFEARTKSHASSIHYVARRNALRMKYKISQLINMKDNT